MIAISLAQVGGCAAAQDPAWTTTESLGRDCDSNLDCEGGSCRRVAAPRKVCTGTCDSDESCVAGWHCQRRSDLDTFPVPLCHCVPLAGELCNGLDDDCDGVIDEACTDSPLADAGGCDDAPEPMMTFEAGVPPTRAIGPAGLAFARICGLDTDRYTISNPGASATTFRVYFSRWSTGAIGVYIRDLDLEVIAPGESWELDPRESFGIDILMDRPLEFGIVSFDEDADFAYSVVWEE